MNKETISGTVVGCDGMPLSRHSIVATAEYHATILIEYGDERPPRPMPSRRFVPIGQAITNAAGYFNLSFDPVKLSPDWGDDQIVSRSSYPGVSVRVVEPDTGFPLTTTTFRSRPYRFSLSVRPVTVLNWEIHFPGGASEFVLGDIAVLTANVRNNFAREVRNLGLRLEMTPECLDNETANGHLDQSEPFEIEVSTGIVLEAAGTGQEGKVRYDPNPLDTKPVAIAFQIPRAIKVVDERIPFSGEFNFNPSGLYRLEAWLVIDHSPCDRAIFRVCVRPGAQREQPGRCQCSGAVRM